jgi:hypothetical protein
MISTKGKAQTSEEALKNRNTGYGTVKVRCFHENF